MTLSECLVDLRNSFLFRQRFTHQDLQRGYSERKNLWWLHVRITIFQVLVETIHTLTICEQRLPFFLSVYSLQTRVLHVIRASLCL